MLHCSLTFVSHVQWTAPLQQGHACQTGTLPFTYYLLLEHDLRLPIYTLCFSRMRNPYQKVTLDLQNVHLHFHVSGHFTFFISSNMHTQF